MNTFVHIVQILTGAFLLGFLFYSTRGVISGIRRNMRITGTLLVALFTGVFWFTPWWVTGIVYGILIVAYVTNFLRDAFLKPVPNPPASQKSKSPSE